MAKVKWIDRELIRSPLYYCLCTTEKEYLREMRKLDIKDPDKWLKGHANATTHYITNDDKATCALVCFRIDDKRTILEMETLLVHEAVHIFQEICVDIGEHKPSHEFQAYGIQRISLNLLHEFHRRLANVPKKTMNKINRQSREALLHE